MKSVSLYGISWNTEKIDGYFWSEGIKRVSSRGFQKKGRNQRKQQVFELLWESKGNKIGCDP